VPKPPGKTERWSPDVCSAATRCHDRTSLARSLASQSDMAERVGIRTQIDGSTLVHVTGTHVKIGGLEAIEIAWF
jgi:hypothetical protein